MKRPHRRKGASAVEFALVAPLLIAVVTALMDWSWYLFQWFTITHAGEQGVRIAAGVADDPGSVADTAVRNSMEANGLPATGAIIGTALTTEASGQQVFSITVEVPFQPPVGLVPTPTSLRTKASTTWYGYLYEEDP